MTVSRREIVELWQRAQEALLSEHYCPPISKTLTLKIPQILKWENMSHSRGRRYARHRPLLVRNNWERGPFGFFDYADR